MSRRRLSALGLLMMLAATVSAGDSGVHYWPARFPPEHIAQVRVLMDIGYWLDLVNLPDTIKLRQVDLYTYEGGLDLSVRCNFPLSMRCTIEPNGEVPGQYSCWMDGRDIDPPAGTAHLGVRLENANTAAQLGGTTNIPVAIVTIRITPRL
jgi:hypothetical protein